jgi:hypothetical protein
MNMKKILTGVLALLMGASVTMAQTPAKQEKAKAAHRSEKPDQKAQRPALDSVGKPMKKDGTADKRFKENKPVKDTARGPLKKDGTPDKRFKENKEAKAEGPKKQDGTPDKRFKENKEKKAAEKKA